MTFEKYLTDNCGLRILEGLTNLGMETTECTFPGRLWDEQYPERMDEHQIGTFCMPVDADVERVYYRVKDTVRPWAVTSDGSGEGEESSKDSRDLDFLILFTVEFAVIENREDRCDVGGKFRKYYAQCQADIEDGALRNFQMTGAFDKTMMTELDIEMRCREEEFSNFPVKALKKEKLEERADAFLERYYPEAKTEPMAVPVRRIFKKEFGMHLSCDGDKNRFAMTCEACRQLWDAAACRLMELLDEKDGDPPFPEECYRIMDRNAKRTAAGILIPAASLTPMVWGWLGAYAEEIKGAEAGSLLSHIVYSLAEEYGVSVQAMKIRLEDLGFSIFSGVLNHLDGIYIPSFTTAEDNPAKCDRYLIGMSQLKELLQDQPELLDLCEKEKLVYVEGKLVLNQCEYVQVEAGERTLTPYARSHVDECCLRFRGIRGRGGKPSSSKVAIYELGSNRRFRGCMRRGGTAGE